MRSRERLYIVSPLSRALVDSTFQCTGWDARTCGVEGLHQCSDTQLAFARLYEFQYQSLTPDLSANQTRARQLAATPILNSFPPQQRKAKKYMSCVLVAQINQNVRAAYFILPHVYNPSTDRQENNSELQRISVRSYTETYFFEHQSFSSHSLIWKSTGLLYLQQQIATFSEEKWERCLHVHKPTPWG